jgi:ADP-heptose:LPS heptosyltransferase
VRVEVQRAVDRLVGVPLCAALSAWDGLWRRLRGAEAPREARAAREPRRILVVLLSEMGSLVLAYPMFTRLRERYPGCELYALMFAKNREVLDLLEVMPRDHVVTLRDRSLPELLSDSVSALRRLRALDLDVVIDCELFARISALFSRLSGAALRVGFHRHTQEGLYRGSFMNRPVPYNPYRHISEQFLSLADAIGTAASPLTKLEAALPWPRPAHAYALPALHLADGEVEASRARLEAQHPATIGRRLVLVYGGGGILPIRAWPEASYVALVRALLERGCAVGLIGLADDRPLATRIRDTLAHPHCVDLTGYTRNIRELVVLFHHADLLVSNDGGPGQFAAMTPIASIVLFGPETPALYGSLSPRAVSLHRADMPCSPCLTAYNHRNSFCDGDNQCLKRIEPVTVLDRALALLDAAPTA